MNEKTGTGAKEDEERELGQREEREIEQKEEREKKKRRRRETKKELWCNISNRL